MNLEIRGNITQLTFFGKINDCSKDHSRIAQREELTEQTDMSTIVTGRQVPVVYLVVHTLLTISKGIESYHVNVQGRDKQH